MKKTIILISCLILSSFFIYHHSLRGNNTKEIDQQDSTLTTKTESVNDIFTNNSLLDYCLTEDSLIETDGYYKFTPFGVACYKGDLPLLKKMLDKNPKGFMGMTDDIYEFNLLYVAVCFEKIDIVKFLLTLGYDVNQIYTEDGLTALSIACMDANYDMVSLLLNAGADVNVGGGGGDYPTYSIIEAVETGNAKIVKLLLEYGADVNVTNYDGDTPLMVAQRERSNSIVEMIFNKY